MRGVPSQAEPGHGDQPPRRHCQELLETTCEGEGGELVTLQSNAGLFYASLGDAITQTLALVLPNQLKLAWWCHREAAEVHSHLGAMGKLGSKYCTSEGVEQNPAQAAHWFQKAADLEDVGSKAALSAMLLQMKPQARVTWDAPRGSELLREAVEQGCGQALFQLAVCYLRGEGVEKDAAHGLAHLR